MPRILVQGMHGLGDNLHQRAVLRQLMKGNEVWLESSWVAPYHDIIAEGLHVVRKPTSLRTQAGNAEREKDRFEPTPAGRFDRTIEVWYRPDQVRRWGSVLGAICETTGTDIETADFRLPVPAVWIERARRAIGNPLKPILVYRPLVERSEWNGCRARNPDADAYHKLFMGITSAFHVVSIADLLDGKEWLSGYPIEADQTFHKGELEFEALAGLFSLASLVWCSPGFAVILAQAVGTPVICTFGGYERAYSFSAGARFSPYLGVEPIKPTDSFTHDNRHDKRIDIVEARQRISEFVAAHCLAIAV